MNGRWFFPLRAIPIALALGLHPAFGDNGDPFPSIGTLPRPVVPSVTPTPSVTPVSTTGFPSNDVLRGQNVSLAIEGFTFGSGVTRGEDGKMTGNGVEVVKQTWAGSGFIVGEDGTLITNYHVAARALKIQAKFDDGATYQVNHLKVYDPDNDLAVLKIAGNRTFSPVRLGDSDHVEPRDDVLAVGNPKDTGLNITEGKISQVRKDRDGRIIALQHTAPIAQGSSGGALYRGHEVIGVNVRLYSGTSFYQAVPINLTKELISEKYRKIKRLEDVFDPLKSLKPDNLEEVGKVSQQVAGQKDKTPGTYSVDVSLEPIGDYCMVLKNSANVDLDLAVKNNQSDEIVGLATDSDKAQEILLLNGEGGSELSVIVLNNGRRAVPFTLTLNKIIW